MFRLLLYCLILFNAELQAQSTTIEKPLNPLPKNVTDWSSQVILTDHMGRPFRPGYSDIEGDPYYFNSWKSTTARSEAGILRGILKIKYDIFHMEVDCLSADNDSLIIQDGILKEFVLHDSMMTGKDYLFRAGYPNIDKNTDKTYYLVLSDGQLQFLKASRKELKINKDDLTGQTSKEFIQYDEYYIFRKGEMLKWKRNKDAVLGLMSDMQRKIEAYLNKVNVNFKSVESTATLFDYYNSQLKAF